MNATQLIATLRAAGWPNERDILVTMAAIALAESSGIPTAHNPRAPDDSYGLWQINMYGNLGPSRRARYRLSSNRDLFDPLTNAKAALDIYRTQGLRAWGVYTHPPGNPAYRKHLGKAQAAFDGFQDPGNFTEPPTSGADDDSNDTVIYSGIGFLALFLIAAKVLRG